MNKKQIQERMAAIKDELQQDGADIQALRTEFDGLKEQLDKIIQDDEARKSLLDDIANERLGVRVDLNPPKDVVKKASDEHYRTAFLKTLLRMPLTEEEERAYVHTTQNTEAVIPKDLQNQIYTNMEEAHPILKDVQIIRSGAVLSIVKHTAIVAGDADNVAEGVANSDEQNTFVNVDLSGKDISKHVDFSYRLGKMAIPAFEAYLVQEIGARIGSQWAKNIVAQIKSDLNAANKINAATPGTLTIDDFLNGMSKLKGVGPVVVYGNNASFYGNIATMKDPDRRISYIPDYHNNIKAQVLGNPFKQEDALADGEILILDPKQYIENVVQDLLIERDKDIKTHVHTIAGLVIAGGTLTNDKAGALITVGTAG